MKTAEALLCVRFSSNYSLEELNEICLADSDAISSIYMFESKMTRAAFSSSDLGKGIPSRYRMIPETIRVEYYDMLIVLNEDESV